MKTVTFQMQELTCPSCVKNIERVLARLVGVISSRVLFHASKVKVQYDDKQIEPMTIANSLKEIGYPVSKII